ncbi:alkane 1-monooxygenase [Ginsengibacter hankyongi]|uniref:Alkane 1-monooxygenase n=1 Tax=Ginsengibacter hankyongi TaxID=2607284 RepID=A0A5J5IK29_9BACT|nr:alkane 1-monooxygenase [Ginsengibacter hankyongi]KAA9039542.1 alkane 1-monooxygenase [Ginsengibacter hankyongi]
MKPVNYLIFLFIPALVIAGYLLGSWWNFLVPLCCFVVYPLSNFFLWPALKNNTERECHYSSSAYKYVALIFVPVLIVLTAWAVYVAGTATITTVSFIGLALSVGIVNGVLGFTLAHEFIHRFTRTEQVAGYLLLLQNNYMHYGIEHVWGHHVYTCTPEDPHTARISEPLYFYLFRAVKGTYKNAWNIDTKKSGRASGKFSIMRSRMLLFGFLQVGMMLIIFFTLGAISLLFFLLQNIGAIALLHIINYLQHYGLMRKLNAGGYERLNAHHAWNTGRYNRLINLFQLESHADHHMHPNRSFDKLSQHEESPSHPAGYSFMILLALVPPLWFRMMNKRINPVKA